MISTTEAKKIIQANVQPKVAVNMSLKDAAGLTLASDVYATTDIPAFPQSSMDGFAISFDRWRLHNELHIEGEMPAGATQYIEISPEEAVRIFTGAPVPPGADTVVVQEKTKTNGKQLIIEDEQLQKGANVRLQGSEIKAGQLALSKGSRLSPAAVGFLAGIGVTDVGVYPLPSITIIITGNELQQPGKPLEYGQVYESNSVALTAALQQLHLAVRQTFFAHDDLKKLEKALGQALEESDLVLLTGGVSVGDYDFVVQAANQCGVMQQFYKVAQKPGKPLYFGTKESKLIFGLPGNPASVLTCFYQYVIVALEQLLCRKELIKTTQLPLAAPYTKKAGFTHFLKGWCDAGSVTPLRGQESYKLASFATANCFIVLDEAGTTYQEGDVVTVHLLP